MESKGSKLPYLDIFADDNGQPIPDLIFNMGVTANQDTTGPHSSYPTPTLSTLVGEGPQMIGRPAPSTVIHGEQVAVKEDASKESLRENMAAPSGIEEATAKAEGTPKNTRSGQSFRSFGLRPKPVVTTHRH